jgi:hypothetical protein
MEMIAMRSDVIAAVGYDPGTRRMRSRFQQGHFYDFCNVPLDIYNGLIAAASKGAYYNQHIRDRYQCGGPSSTWKDGHPCKGFS